MAASYDGDGNRVFQVSRKEVEQYVEKDSVSNSADAKDSHESAKDNTQSQLEDASGLDDTLQAEQGTVKTYYERVYADPVNTIFWYGFGQGMLNFVGNINSALSAYLSDWFCHAWDYITGQYELVLHSENGYIGDYSEDDIEAMRRAGLTEEDIAEIVGIVVDEEGNSVVEYTESSDSSQPSSSEKPSGGEPIVIPSNPDEKTRVDYELTYYVNDVNTENTQVLMEYGKRDELKSVYTYGNERISAETIADTYNPVTDDFETDYYLYDGRGSVAQVVSSSEIVESYTYDPFGNVTSGAPDFDSFYGYNAEDTNPVTGLQYLRARYYDTEDGRFSVADTYLGDVSEPLTLNRYSYTVNNPVMQSDPSGHWPKWLDKAAKKVGNFVQKHADVIGVAVGIAAGVAVGIAVAVSAPISVPALAIAAGVVAGVGVAVACVGIGGSVKTNYQYKKYNKKVSQLENDYNDIVAEVNKLTSNGGSLSASQISYYQRKLQKVEERRKQLCESGEKLQKQADIYENITYAGLGLAAIGMSSIAGPVLLSSMAGNSVLASMPLVGSMTYGGAATTTLATSGALGTAYAGSNIVEAETGYNPIKDTIYGGNDELFEEHQQVLNAINTTTVITGTAAVVEKSAQSLVQENLDDGYPNDVNQYEKLKSEYAADEIYNAERVGNALKDDPTHRAASYLSKEQLASGRTYSFTGGDSKSYTLLQTKGQLNGVDGIYEYITNDMGQVTHQRFIQGGVYTGFPNQIVPKGGY